MTTEKAFSIDLFSRTLGYQLRRTQVRFYALSGPMFERNNVTPGQYAVLSTIGENPGCAQIQVARALSIDPPALVGVLDKLVKRNLVEKRQSKIDRRSSELFLTAEGEKSYALITQEVNDIDASIREQFTPEEFDQFSDFIKRLNLFFDQKEI